MYINYNLNHNYQTARIISTYTADVSGVCSALFELGGMSVIHDASGCNSTYNTHDEPRWYDFDSMVFLSGISEMEAIMGNDEKLIHDVISAAEQLSPKFIALAGTPIPMMVGTDFKAIASVIEKQTGIPCMGIPTNGMHTYVQGVSMAMQTLAEKFVTESMPKTKKISVNLLGVTPLDFSLNGSVQHMHDLLNQNQIEVVSCWCMGDSLENLKLAPSAHVNLVVSYAGIGAAEYLAKKFGIPYLIARPYGKAFSSEIIRAIRNLSDYPKNQKNLQNSVLCRNQEIPGNPEIIMIGEGISSESLARAIERETGKTVGTIIATEYDTNFLSENARIARDEAELIPILKNPDLKYLIADPLYQPICPKSVKFIRLGHEGFSGRIYHDLMPDLTEDLHWILNQL
ncbi:MAG: nitrogenase component 1 [Oscillospiraceae bacterium]|nr:nitrogenase component 1 [Oscillospiraceae bacterium]